MGLIRLLLALTVVFAHSPWADGQVMVGGRNAVQLFYVISGFLIYHILCNGNAYDRTLKFYANRALRLFPIYYVVAALVLIYHLIAGDGFFAFYESIPTDAALFLALSNAVIFGQDWVHFTGVTNGEFVFSTNFWSADIMTYKGLLIPQAWTLGVELSFYLIAPFVLRRTWLLISALVASVLVRAVLVKMGLAFSDPWSYRFFPAELSFFLIGALSNKYLLPVWKAVIHRPHFKSLPAATVTMMATLFAAYPWLPLPSALKSVMLAGSFALTIPLLFLYRSKQLDSAMGDLSYPLYICHMLVIWIVQDISKSSLPLTAGWITLVNIICSIALAVLLNKFVGDVVEQYRSRIKAQGRAPMPLPGSKRPAAHGALDTPS